MVLKFLEGSVLLILLTAPIFASFSSPPVTYVLHESRKDAVIQSRYLQSSQLESSTILPMRIGLKQRNLHRGEEFLMQVAHPDSAMYGQHWTPEQIIQTFAPTQESSSAVEEWLSQAGIHSSRIEVSKSQSWMHINVTVFEAEKLLKTTFHEYRHSDNDHVTIGCEEYKLPTTISDHIDLITPTVHFDRQFAVSRRSVHQAAQSTQVAARSLPSSPDDLSNCDSVITLACLRALYEIPPCEGQPSNTSLGIYEQSPNIFLQSDLDEFFTVYSPDIVGHGPTIELINNAVPGSSASVEASLDVQYSLPFLYPLKVTLYEVNGTANTLLDALDSIYCTSTGDDPTENGDPSTTTCGGSDAADVISASYSGIESSYVPSYMERQCNEYMKLGLLGVTFLFSSGDVGVAGSGYCYPNAQHVGQFGPTFPGTCPYITSVGATQINPNSTVNDPESACEQVIYSGGGFSNVFPLLEYQAGAVNYWWSHHPENYTSFNTSQVSRGFPDVSANGANYNTAVNGNFTLVYGTSASTPLFASLITLINNARINAGKGRVGFINPVLYANPDMFNDITSGSNPGCGTEGFYAIKGWDPVTGLGTPNFPKMLEVFMALP